MPTIRTPTTSSGCSSVATAPRTWAAGPTRGSTRSSPRPPRATTPTSRSVSTGRRRTSWRDEVPIIPLGYGGTWALSREGLLGAAVSGVGILRYAGSRGTDDERSSLAPAQPGHPPHLARRDPRRHRRGSGRSGLRAGGRGPDQRHVRRSDGRRCLRRAGHVPDALRGRRAPGSCRAREPAAGRTHVGRDRRRGGRAAGRDLGGRASSWTATSCRTRCTAIGSVP